MYLVKVMDYIYNDDGLSDTDLGRNQFCIYSTNLDTGLETNVLAGNQT